MANPSTVLHPDPRMSKLLRMFYEARAVKDVIERDWMNVRDMLRGNQMHPDRPRHKPPAVLNLIRPLVERKIAMMTDTKPRFNVLPTLVGDNYAAAAKILDETCNAWWDHFGMDSAIVRCLLYAQAYGTFVTQTRWSKIRNDIVVDVIDPRNFYVDPYIMYPEQLRDAEYVILEDFPPLEEVRMMFPNQASQIKPWSPPPRDASPEGWLTRVRQRFMGGSGYQRPVPESAVSRTLLRHYWIRDYTTKDQDVDGKPLARRKYPGGRYIIWGYGNVILHDEPNPYLDMCHPFDMMDWYPDLEGPWGDGEVFAQRNPQLLLNKLAEVLVENGMLMNNAIWIADKTAFPATDGPDGWGQLTNIPGQIVKKRPGTEVRRDYPPGIPSSMMQLVQHLEQFIESRAGGFPEIMTKGKAGQVQSGLGIESLLMSASAMIRLKARSLEALIQRIGQKMISRVIQFYTNDRVIHILGPGEEFVQYNFIRGAFTEALGPEALRDAHRTFRFRVVPGSSLSLTRIQKGLMAVQLYSMGCIDREAVLEAVEWPNRKEILKRTVQEQMLGLEGAGKGKSKRGYGPVERNTRVPGRT